MKKQLSIVLCIAMIFAMLATLSGCGEKEKDKFVGTWKTDLDMTEMINEGFSEDADMATYFKFDEFKITMVFTFNEDGTYKSDIDEDAFNTAYDGLVQSFTKGMKDYLEATAKKQGLNLSADEMLKLSGTTMDAAIKESLNKDTLKNSFDEIKGEGTFEAKDGNLILTDSKTNETSSESYEFVSDSELKLVKPANSDGEELNKIYPLILKKK